MDDNWLEKMEQSHQNFLEEKSKKARYLNVENLSKTLNIKGIERLDELSMPDCSISASDLIDWAVKKIAQLEDENDRMANALDYVLESGSVGDFDGVQKARWGLGLVVEDEQRIAALKPRFS
jgi:hypothetical protein